MRTFGTMILTEDEKSIVITLFKSEDHSLVISQLRRAKKMSYQAFTKSVRNLYRLRILDSRAEGNTTENMFINYWLTNPGKTLGSILYSLLLWPRGFVLKGDMYFAMNKFAFSPDQVLSSINHLLKIGVIEKEEAYVDDMGVIQETGEEKIQYLNYQQSINI